MKFIKSFALGLLYFFLFPFIVAACAVIAVFSIPNFFFQFIKMMVNFFKGRELFPRDKKDIKAAEVLKARHSAPQPTTNTSNTYIQNNYYGTPNQNQNNPYGNQLPNQQARFGQIPNPQFGEIPAQPNPTGQIPQNPQPQNPQYTQIENSATPIEVNEEDKL